MTFILNCTFLKAGLILITLPVSSNSITPSGKAESISTNFSQNTIQEPFS